MICCTIVYNCTISRIPIIWVLCFRDSINCYYVNNNILFITLLFCYFTSAFDILHERLFNSFIHWKTEGLALMFTKLYYTIIYCTILYSTILYYTILYSTIPYYTIRDYTILYYTMLYYTYYYK